MPAPLELPMLVEVLQWNGQRDADPEAASHVAQFGIIFFDCRGGPRFERHAADRASAGLVADYLRVHGTGVFRLCQRGRKFWF